MSKLLDTDNESTNRSHHHNFFVTGITV